jgi:heme/copper-type cytochrome/quinol oxidase subunit 3
MAVNAQARYPRYVAGTRAPASWGMLMLILTEGIFFSLLFASYWYIRTGSDTWPQGGIKAPELLIPSIGTAILLSSSIPMQWAEMSIRRGNQLALRAGLAIAFIMGVTFLAIQLNEYAHSEFKPQENAYASLFFLITAFHGAHVFLALLMNVFTQARAWTGGFDKRRHLAVQNASWYWHFVDVVWIFIFGFLYIAPHFT